VKVKREGEDALLIVETTSPLGFDPSPEAQASILAQVAAAPTRGERSLVPADGARVSNLILVGAMFVNRASIAQESGDLALAERLFARGESFAVGETMRSLLRDQRAALLSQLGADDILSNDPERLPRAHQTLRAAALLDPKDEQIRANVLQNLRAAAERIIAKDADAQDETGVLGVMAEVTELGIGLDDRSGLKAFAMSEISRLRAAKGDLDGAVSAIELALNEQLAPRDAPLKGTLEQNHIAALRLAAMSSAKRGDYDKSIKLIERLLSIPTLTGQQKRECDADRLRAIQWAGQKQMEQQNYQAAADIYRQGVRLAPENTALRQNLVAALERTLMPKIERGECTALTDPIDELRTLDKDSTFPEKALVRCLTVRANELLKNGSEEEAITILRMALKESPKNPLVARNLGLALFQGAQRMVAAGNCKKANELAKELRNVDTSALSAQDLDHALQPCRGR
jgi:tetratricopeptide (TPR) repeat protein